MLIVIPSRGRPAQLSRLLAAMIETRVSSRVIIRLDEDDPVLLDYSAPGWEVRVGPSHGAAPAAQDVFEANPIERCYMVVPDDTIPRTPGWDQRLALAAGLWRIAYPDDMINGPRFASYQAIGGDFVRAIGWYQLPGIRHLYADAVWDHLGRLYGNLVYRGDVVLEHLHHTTGKAPLDETHRRAVASRAKDKALFDAWKATYRIDPRLAMAVAA